MYCRPMGSLHGSPSTHSGTHAHKMFSISLHVQYMYMYMYMYNYVHVHVLVCARFNYILTDIISLHVCVQCTHTYTHTHWLL